MSELKTLNDLYLDNDFVKVAIEQYPSQGYVSHERLKEEAIKRINFIKSIPKLTDFDYGAINILKVFFDLIEDDLDKEQIN